MIVPNGITIYIKGKKYKSGQECPDELFKKSEKKYTKKVEVKKTEIKKDEILSD